MTLLTREQVIAWVDEQITRLKRNRASSPSGIDPRFTYEIACCEAILTLLQSAETVAQERDSYRNGFVCVQDAVKEMFPAEYADTERDHHESNNSSAANIIVCALRDVQAERDRLTQEVERLKAEYLTVHTLMTIYNVGGWTDAVSPMKRALKAEAEATRLRGMWEALKAWSLHTYADDELTASGSERLCKKITELEATPSGPAEEGRCETVDRVIQAVAELPDRTSPDEWPEAMLVTADELRTIIVAALRGQP